jgi:hypothetical protein
VEPTDTGTDVKPTEAAGPAAPHDLEVLRARHHAANTLLAYLAAVDAHDLAGVLRALGDATVSFGGPTLQGGDALTLAYTSAFTAGGRTKHLLHELAVTPASDENGAGVVAWAAYQRWSLETDPPTLEALGVYRALFIPDDHPGSWRLVYLRVHRDWQRTTA